MKYLATVSTLLFLLLALPAGALPQEASPAPDEIPDTLRVQYDSAYFAWDRGDYVEALEHAQDVLTAPEGEQLLDEVAGLTGERYHVEEIAPDGQEVRWSPDGRYAAYETSSDNETRTHVVALRAEGAEQVASFEGREAVFSPDGHRLAYLLLEETPELEAAREAEEEALEAQDYQEVRRLRAEIAHLEADATRLFIRDLETGDEEEQTRSGLGKYALTYGEDGTLLLVGRAEGAGRIDLFALEEGEEARRLTEEYPLGGATVLTAGPDRVIYTAGRDSLVVQNIRSGEARLVRGSEPAVSNDGSTLAFLSTVEELDEDVARGEAVAGADVQASGHMQALQVLALEGDDDEPEELRRTTLPVSSPALSPSGEKVAYMMMSRDDWEFYISPTDSLQEERVTWEIQHDFFPQFLSEDRLLGLMGEARHRRSYLYELERDSAEVQAERLLPGRDQRGRTELFHNNTLRTVAPQYEWVADPEGHRVLVVADRDGNTLSPERGVYLVDLERPVTREEVLERIEGNLEDERDLRARGRELFEPIEEEVRAATAEVSVGRISDYAHALYQMDSKWYEQPGSQEAIAYLTEKLRQMGYEPDVQWFEPQEGARAANVVATLDGTAEPETVYVISSHYDSVERSPGADDNSSGTTALLEAARVLAERPQEATIQFAFLAAEEAGLLGAREFVRRAVDESTEIAGVINNDMLGWTRSHRLDNTIRYSNDAIRDIQHAAALQFSDLITYDARYVLGTDAGVFYEEYGDVIGGTGSYPILGNPHYHQPHDHLEVINQRLVAEVSRTTVAAIMRLASGPPPVSELELEETTSGVYEARWTGGEEHIARYEVSYGPSEDPERSQVTVEESRVVLEDAEPGWQVSVEAVSELGLPSWDRARATVPEGAVSN